MISWPNDLFADIFFSNELFVRGDQKFIELACSVFKRDKFTCKICNFHCPPSNENLSAYFQVRALDNNYKNLKEQNLICICPFCHAPFNLRASAKSGKFTAIVKSADISAVEISLISKAVFAELTSNRNSHFEAAKAIYSEFNGLSNSIAQLMPKMPSQQLTLMRTTGTSNEKVLQSFLMNISFLAESYSNPKVQEFLGKICLFPIFDKFVDEANFWQKNSFSENKDTQLLNKLLNQI